MPRTLPLILTLARLAAPLMICPLLLLPGAWAAWLAAILFTMAAVSDWADGWLARRMAAETNWGKILDPIADKMLVLLVLFGLAAAQRLDGWALLFTFILLSRELAMSALRQSFAEHRRPMPVGWLSKFKTFLSYVAGGLLILGGSAVVRGTWLLGLGLIPALISLLLHIRNAVAE